MASPPAELLAALAEPHCVICALAARHAHTYLQGVVRDGVNDPPLRDRWRRSGGLCGRHWADLRAQENPALPVAIVTRDLLAHYLESGVPAGACPACEIANDAEKRYLRTLARLRPQALDAALASGTGFVCLRHLEALPHGKVQSALRARLEQLLDELDTFTRKLDYRFANEPMGNERDSWLRAVRALGGWV